jgi:glycosyltransferase involved in cell wall biosynthesis
VLGDAAIYVPPGDAEALAAALRTLRGDIARLKLLQQEAADLARRRFTPRAVTRQLADLLRGRTAGSDAPPQPAPSYGGG